MGANGFPPISQRRRMLDYPPLRSCNILKTFCFSFQNQNFQLELCRRRCWFAFPCFRGDREENKTKQKPVKIGKCYSNIMKKSKIITNPSRGLLSYYWELLFFSYYAYTEAPTFSHCKLRNFFLKRRA